MKSSKISDESKALHKLYRDGEIDHETLEDSMTGLALLPPPETALEVYSRPNGLDPYLDSVKDKIAEFKANPPSLETEKGRSQYKSMARKVASFKTALDGMGKDLVDELKDKPKKVDAERKRIRELLDEWRDDVRKPVDDWEEEQRLLQEKRAAEEAAKALLIQIENDHEIGLLLNDKFDRDAAEAKAIAEQQRTEYEARIASEAAARATREAEEKAAQAQKDSQLAIERAQREKLEAEAREIKAKQDAEIAAKLAAEKAERERLQAIKDTEFRIARDKELADSAAAKLAANKAHQKRINNEAMVDLIAFGLSEEKSKLLIIAIVQGKIRNIDVNY